MLASLLLYMVVYLLMFPTGIAFMVGHGARAACRARRSSARPIEGCQSADPVPTAHGATAGAERMMPTARSTWCRSGRVILGVGVFFYVLLDGFDLGVGMLYGFAPEGSKDLVMNSVAPIWDGNETWLILGGVGLLAAFPLAFAIIIPAVYFPILAMLLGLVFRGVAFEFRFKQPRLRRFWAGGFCVGSAVAAFSQGAVLGAFIQGFKVDGRNFAGTSFDWLTPFSVLTGVALMFGYGLLGAGWLIMKTEGDAAGLGAPHGPRLFRWRAGRDRHRQRLDAARWSRRSPQRWFSWPNIAAAGAGAADHAGDRGRRMARR